MSELYGWQGTDMQFEDLSTQEQDACTLADIRAAKDGIGFVPQQTWPKAFRAGWMACKLWTFDHLATAQESAAIPELTIPDPEHGTIVRWLMDGYSWDCKCGAAGHIVPTIEEARKNAGEHLRAWDNIA